MKSFYCTESHDFTLLLPVVKISLDSGILVIRRKHMQCSTHLVYIVIPHLCATFMFQIRSLIQKPLSFGLLQFKFCVKILLSFS